MGKNSVTILLPVHNDEMYLANCLISLKNQSHTKFNCLIGFNGTEDKSKDIFQELVGNDPRFKDLDYGKESGKSITLNKMLKEVQAEITCLIDGDDMWHKDKLKTQIEIAANYDVIGTLTTYINEKNNPLLNISLQEFSDDISKGMLAGNNQIINSSCFVKTECFKKIGGWDPEVEGLEDYDAWVKIALLGKRFYNIQEFLTYHRIHSGSNFNSKSLNITPMDILNRNRFR